MPPGLCALVLLAAAWPAAAKDHAAEPSARMVRARYLMGTVFRFEAPAGRDAAATAAALEAALDEVGRWERILSNWDRKSEVSRLNARAGMGNAEVSEDLLQAVSVALHWAGATGGAFDPTVEPLTRVFRGQPAAVSVPSTKARPRWSAVEVDATRRWVSIPTGSGLDFGGIGKGIALDQAAALLRGRGISAALLDAGGQLLALGAPPGEKGWRIGVSDPQRRDQSIVTLVLKNASAATSGNAERPGEVLDPESGLPIAGSGSATAVAARATSADALSTALFVMGTQRGLEYARARHDLIAVFVQPRSPSRGVAPVVANLPGDPESTLFVIVGPEDPADGRLRVEAR